MDGMSDTGTWKPVDLAIQGSPSLEGRVLEDQRTILAIARTEDNPHSMKEACNELQRKGRHYGYHVQADSVINSAWQTYIITQTKKAEKFAEAGNLPKALEHFGNVEALPGLKIKDEYWENRAKIIGVGVITTPAEVCLDEALEYAKLGRIQGASSLCSAARDCEAAKSETYEISEGTFLRVDGKEVSMGVRLYDSAGDTIYGPGKKQPERTTEINQKLRYTMKIAYQHSIENKLAEAIGCAVTPGLYPEAYITPKLEDIKSSNILNVLEASNKLFWPTLALA